MSIHLHFSCPKQPYEFLQNFVLSFYIKISSELKFDLYQSTIILTLLKKIFAEKSGKPM